MNACVGAMLVLAIACARETTHRVLTFFYDGVPPLDAGLLQADAGAAEDPTTAAPGTASDPNAFRATFYEHPAYRDNRCGGCHDTDIGGLLMSAREGLCVSCHPDNPPRKAFVHGPVAVNGCLACHRYHRSPYPGILVTDAQALCFECHVMEELVTDKHHATMDEERCIDCHDPHGGDDRFFLIEQASEPESGPTSSLNETGGTIDAGGPEPARSWVGRRNRPT